MKETSVRPSCSHTYANVYNTRLINKLNQKLINIEHVKKNTAGGNLLWVGLCVSIIPLAMLVGVRTPDSAWRASRDEWYRPLTKSDLTILRLGVGRNKARNLNP